MSGRDEARKEWKDTQCSCSYALGEVLSHLVALARTVATHECQPLASVCVCVNGGEGGKFC